MIPPPKVSFSSVRKLFVKMTRVFIGRLSMQARRQDVESFLSGYGRIRDVSLKRGYGFVVGTHLAVRKAAIFLSSYPRVFSGIRWLQRCRRRYWWFEWDLSPRRMVCLNKLHHSRLRVIWACTDTSESRTLLKRTRGVGPCRTSRTPL